MSAVLPERKTEDALVAIDNEMMSLDAKDDIQLKYLQLKVMDCRLK